MTDRQQQAASLHLTERFGTVYLAATYPKDGPRPGAANKLLRDLGPDRPEAEAVLAELQRRLHEPGIINGTTPTK